MKVIALCTVLLLALGHMEAAPKKKGEASKSDAQSSTSSSPVAECHVTHGKKLITFGQTLEYIKFPCKYNAVRKTVCGNFELTISPGNMLETDRNKLYVIRSMWVGLTRLSDGLKWEGRTDLKIASKYLEGLTDAPFNTKDGSLAIDKVVDFSSPTEDGQVSMTAKNGDFKISFGLFNPEGNWHKDSTFSFQCFSSKFVPSDYPDQLCGNGTTMEVKSFKKSMEWRENRQATLFYNVFSSMDIVQTDSDCASAQRAMSNRCVQKGKDLRYKAALLCWPLVGKPLHQRCISANMDSPISAFRHCVEFVCSDFKDKNSCMALGTELDLCPSLPGVSEKVRSTCKSDLDVGF